VDQTLKAGDAQIDGTLLADVCRRYGVKELSLFGSAVRGEMRSESDIDLIVEFEPTARVGLIKFESLVEELGHLPDTGSIWLPRRAKALDTCWGSQRRPGHLCGMSRGTIL